MLLDFEENLKNELGDVVVEELKAKRKELTKLSNEWYETQVAHYKTLVEKVIHTPTSTNE